MRDDALDAVDPDLATGHGLPGGGGHRGDGVLEHLLPVHPEVVQPVGDGAARGRVQAAAAWLGEYRCLPAVGTHAGGQQAVGVFAVLQHSRARTVTEEDAGVAILPVYNGGEFLRADHQHGVVGARHDELLPDLKPVNESGAGRLHVEGSRVVCAEFFLHEAGGRGERHVRRDGGQDD